jgi:peptide/nickel transport system permease protein
MAKTARITEGIKKFLLQYAHHRGAVLGLLIITSLLVISILAPFIFSHPYDFSNNVCYPMSVENPMGTDEYGRDILSRVMWGTRSAFIVAGGAAGLSLIIGIVIGAIAGFYSGLIGQLLSRIIEMFLMIPQLFLMIVIMSLFGSRLYFVMIVIALTIWPSNARIMMAQVLTLKNREFVQASYGLGASSSRLLIKHIIPNGISSVIVNSTLQMGSAILAEAGLSFLGFGDRNVITWGQMIQDGQSYLSTAWWMALFPGFVMLVLVLSFNLIGDGINYTLNPRLRERKA